MKERSLLLLAFAVGGALVPFWILNGGSLLTNQKGEPPHQLLSQWPIAYEPFTSTASSLDLTRGKRDFCFLSPQTFLLTPRSAHEPPVTSARVARREEMEDIRRGVQVVEDPTRERIISQRSLDVIYIYLDWGHPSEK